MNIGFPSLYQLSKVRSVSAGLRGKIPACMYFVIPYMHPVLPCATSSFIKEALKSVEKVNEKCEANVHRFKSMRNLDRWPIQG